MYLDKKWEERAGEERRTRSSRNVNFYEVKLKLREAGGEERRRIRSRSVYFYDVKLTCLLSRGCRRKERQFLFLQALATSLDSIKFYTTHYLLYAVE